ncbi:MAG TPA: hypothetical protein DEQ50_10540 [Lactobacillus sp.]|nr:hypothetical protein [Lactobacillus sp.]
MVDLDKTDQDVRDMAKMNDKLIDIFIEDIKDDYSEKTIKSYRKALTLYLNEFLAYRLISIFNLEASSVGELYMHGSSLTETKRVQRSMAKLYTYLFIY